MNYRHAFHAGNFADVLKHAVLVLVIEYLKRKAAAFRVVDTHAGCGRYELDSGAAEKTGEWRGGIGRLIGPRAEPLSAGVAGLLRPYLDVVRAENAKAADGVVVYPGSPMIARRLLRDQDTLVVNELHPEDYAQLKGLFARDGATKVLGLDGWLALKSLLPPRERRGVVLIDPPFEERDDLARLAKGLEEGLKRFATGVYLAWYPIKDPKPIARFHAELTQALPHDLLRVELMIQGPSSIERLNGCGLVVANPPYGLEEQLAEILPELCRCLAGGRGAGYRLDRSRKATAEAEKIPLGRGPGARRKH